MVGDFMEPLWCEGDILPQQLIEILESHEMQEPEETDGTDFAYLSDSDTDCDDDNEIYIHHNHQYCVYLQVVCTFRFEFLKENLN